VKIRLVNVGRDKVNRVVVVKDLDAALDEVKTHLKSQSVQLVRETNLPGNPAERMGGGLFSVRVGPVLLREVGFVEILEAND
jgi:hypothetical protein